MPAALIILLRQLVIALVQTAIFIGLEKAISAVLDAIQRHQIEKNGLSPDDAQKWTENVFVQILIYAGVTFATIRSRVPLKLADKMGLNTRGLTPRKLSPAGEAKVGKTIELPTATGSASAEAVEEVATIVSKTRGLSLSSVKTLLKYTLGAVGATSAFMFMVAQYIDYANWQGSYQKTFQKLLSVVGINPDTPMPKASAVSEDTWKRIYTVVETLRPSGISMPFSGEDRPYSRQNLADVVNEIASRMIADRRDATFKNVMAIVLPLLQRPENFAGVDALPDYKAPVKSTGSTTTYAPSSTPTVKVFTGIVSQGVLGQGLSFEARQDDLIENVGELKSAAANNLAPFLAALPAKVTYEIKIVSSIVTANGFRQSGTTQRIQTGTNRDGTPKYKTVTNKFATLILYILTDRGTRTKLSTVVLGPVDSARFTVSQNDLMNIQTELPKIVTTSDIKEVTDFSNINGLSSPDVKPYSDTQVQSTQEEGVDTGYRFYVFETNGEEYLEVLPWVGNIPVGYTPISKQEFLTRELKKTSENPTRWQPYFADIRRRNPNAFSGGISGYIMVGGVPKANPERYSITQNSSNGKWLVTDKVLNTSKEYDTKASALDATGLANATALEAKTLREYYEAKGETLPNIEQRSILYESLGLGQRSYYVGTSEQNTKLLLALQRQ